MPEVTIMVNKYGNLSQGIKAEPLKRVKVDCQDQDDMWHKASGMADEAVREHAGRVVVQARLVMPAQGGEDYGDDVFTVECRRNMGKDFTTGGF